MCKEKEVMINILKKELSSYIGKPKEEVLGNIQERIKDCLEVFQKSKIVEWMSIKHIETSIENDKIKTTFLLEFPSYLDYN